MSADRLGRMHRDREAAEGRRGRGEFAEGLRAFVEGEPTPEHVADPAEVPFDLPTMRREVRRLVNTTVPGPELEMWQSYEAMLRIIDQIAEVRHADVPVMAALNDLTTVIHEQISKHINRN